MQLSALCRGGVTVRCERRVRPPARAVHVRRESGLSHGLNKVKGTSQPGRLPSPQVPLLHRTKDTPVPTATPTLAELATIAHTHRCSVVATHHRRVLLDDTASPLPFLGVRFGPAVKAVAARIGPADHRAIVVAVNRSGEAIAYDPTTDRIDSDVHRLTALDPARRTLGLTTRPCRRPVWALANLVWLDRVLAAARRTTPLARAAPPASPGRSGATVESGSACSSHAAPADDVGGTSYWFNRGHDHLDTDSSGAGLVVRRGVVRSSLLCAAARSRHRRG